MTEFLWPADWRPAEGGLWVEVDPAQVEIYVHRQSGIVYSYETLAARRWRGRLKGTASGSQGLAMMAFLARLRAGDILVVPDFGYSAPIEAGGELAVQADAGSRELITSGWVPGSKIRAGDRLQVASDRMVMATDAATADEYGNAIIKIDPPLRLAVSESTVLGVSGCVQRFICVPGWAETPATPPYRISYHIELIEKVN